MTTRTRRIALGLTGLLLAGALLAPAPAAASREGRRNTAAVLGGIAAYSLIKGDTRTGVAAGIGAVIAYQRYRSMRPRRRCRCRERVYCPVHRRHPPGWSRGRKVGWHRARR